MVVQHHGHKYNIYLRPGLSLFKKAANKPVEANIIVIY